MSFPEVIIKLSIKVVVQGNNTFSVTVFFTGMKGVIYVNSNLFLTCFKYSDLINCLLDIHGYNSLRCFVSIHRFFCGGTFSSPVELRFNESTGHWFYGCVAISYNCSLFPDYPEIYTP